MEDREIVELYFLRSERAIPESDRKYGAYCRSIACNICENREDAEECVNDTWLRAWNTMPPQRPESLRALLGGISRNLALDRWRRGHRQKRGGGETALCLEELSECVPADFDVEKELELKELGEAVRRFVSSLSPEDSRVFTARYYFLESAADIAARQGVSTGKTKMQLKRLRERLGRYLIKEGLCQEN